jgi:hypothetical protein
MSIRLLAEEVQAQADELATVIIGRRISGVTRRR